MRPDALELKVPPLALTVAAAIAIAAMPEAFDATTSVQRGMAFPIGLAVALTGLLLALRGVHDFRRAGTTVDPRHPQASARLVTTGIYRWTRNPMYLGFVVALVGLAIGVQSAPGLAIAGLTALYLQRFQIIPEERMLRRRFGEAFDVYAGQVRCWL